MDELLTEKVKVRMVLFLLARELETRRVEFGRPVRGHYGISLKESFDFAQELETYNGVSLKLRTDT